MAAKRKTKSNIMRIIGVLCGCLGAGWLFLQGWEGLVDLCSSYTFGNNFFAHFFTTGLYPVAMFLTAILFFVVSVRDLGPMKDGVSIAAIIIQILVAIAYAVYFVNTLSTGFGALGTIWFWYNVLRFVMIIAYIAFAIYCMHGGNSGFGWTTGLVAAIGLVAIGVLGFITEAWGVSSFVYIILSALANIGLLFCGLKQY